MKMRRNYQAFAQGIAKDLEIDGLQGEKTNDGKASSKCCVVEKVVNQTSDLRVDSSVYICLKRIKTM